MIRKPKHLYINSETDIITTLTNMKFQIKLVLEHKFAKGYFLAFLEIVQEGF